MGFADLSRLVVRLQSWRSLSPPDCHLEDQCDALVVQIALLRNKCSPIHRLLAMIRSQGLSLGRERKALSCYLASGLEQKLLRPVQTMILVE